ncbi:MAG: FHA domain-containing protein [Desulfamplus sp.]|nr:FHA domain-containing protein [Desulfamplus sp.]
MADILSLEVMDGPMDGLKVNLTHCMSPISIGRQVGNSMTLAMDMTVSRWHARVAIEGPSWCIEDQNSSYGIVTSRGRENKIPLTRDQIILIGSTIIEIYSSHLPEQDVVINDNCFRDPREIYKMSPEIKEIWDSFFQKSNDSKYCDISGFFKVLVQMNKNIKNQYHCVNEICSTKNWKCLGSWLDRLRISPHYKINPPTKTLISPRLWKIMDIASENNHQSIDFENMLFAIVEEKRNIPARCISGDLDFKNDFKLHPPDNEFSKLNLQNKYKNDEDLGIGINKTSIHGTDAKTTQHAKVSFSENNADHNYIPLLLKHIINFEKIILSFFEDAVHLGMPGQVFLLPGEKNRIENLWHDQYDNDYIDNYLNLLEKYLVGLLAAQRNAPKILEHELGKRIKYVLDTSENQPKGTFLPKKSNGNLSDNIRAVLKGVELEGLSDMIIRNNIKKIIT